MATGTEVLTLLIPNGGWYISGNDFEGIEFLDCEPITKAKFTAGFAQYDSEKAAKDAQTAKNKAALLAKLGITHEEAALLLT